MAIIIAVNYRKCRCFLGHPLWWPKGSLHCLFTFLILEYPFFVSARIRDNVSYQYLRTLRCIQYITLIHFIRSPVMTNYNVVNLNRDVMCMTVIWYHKQSPTTINTSNSTLYFSALFIHSRRLPSIRIALCNRALWCINWGCYQGYKGDNFINQNRLQN